LLAGENKPANAQCLWFLKDVLGILSIKLIQFDPVSLVPRVALDATN